MNNLNQIKREMEKEEIQLVHSFISLIDWLNANGIKTRAGDGKSVVGSLEIYLKGK